MHFFSCDYVIGDPLLPPKKKQKTKTEKLIKRTHLLIIIYSGMNISQMNREI